MAHKPPFLIEYRHQGCVFSLQLLAPKDWPDAEAHVRSLSMTAKVIGSNLQTIPANSVTLPFVSIWVRFLVWFRNRRQRH